MLGVLGRFDSVPLKLLGLMEQPSGEIMSDAKYAPRYSRQ
jgi:hypothetical protein